MELLQLKYFCDAAECEKFSQTAKKFFVPVSNISQSIKRLEEELGTELFEHKGNRVILNNKGKDFYSYVSKALSLLNSGRLCVSDSEENFSGDIKIACVTNYGIVTRTIESFHQKHPNVKFIVNNILSPDASFDILISDTFPSEHREKILLIDDSICVAMAKNHPLVNKESITVKDLENERFITLTETGSLKKILIHACEEAGFSPNLAIQTYDTTYLRKYVKLGLGITFAPAAWKKRHSDDIAFRELDGLRRKTYAFLPQYSYTRKVVEAFVEELKREAENPY